MGGPGLIVAMTSRLGNLRLYKVDVPSYSNIGVILVTQEDRQLGCRFRLTRYTGQRQRDSKAGLSQSFVELLGYLDIVPPACPVLVFHFHIRELHEKDPAPQIDIMEAVMNVLKLDDPMLDVEDAIGTFVRVRPIAPTTTEIVDCYRGIDLCFLCEKGYPKEKEIVYKTVCNHIFHATCISSHLSRTPQCLVCSRELLPVDIRTLLFKA
ncbi:Zinc finger RING-type [Arabidopsis suecica]|uniref:Zinc finger RING-type n=1 Tax=Arabidopsis suecica TaxID=45249 RepID=A0A8T1ZFE4_ARASU|nr:Zinc finger RING-type [Arabidopsis suecica]